MVNDLLDDGTDVVRLLLVDPADPIDPDDPVSILLLCLSFDLA